MDEQKVKKVLEEILERYGAKPLPAADRGKVKSAVSDLIPKMYYPDEHMVLGYAMEADIFWFLLAGASLTKDAAAQAVSRLEKERHMREEDAAFVVKCIVEVRGGVFEGNLKNAAGEKRRPVSFAGGTDIEPTVNFEYTVYDGYVEINRYKNQDIKRSIVIPSTIQGRPVKAIGKRAFNSCKNLISIVIPDTVSEIGEEAFSCCNSLSGIVIPEGVARIRYRTFAGCESLINIVIPDKVTEIGFMAFQRCENLVNIVMSNSVMKIGDWAFQECRGLTYIVIPDGVVMIGDEAFRGCKSLSDIVIPDSVMKIGDRAFLGCENLTRIEISDRTIIGGNAFSGCPNLIIIRRK